MRASGVCCGAGDQCLDNETPILALAACRGIKYLMADDGFGGPRASGLLFGAGDECLVHQTLGSLLSVVLSITGSRSQ